MAKSGLNRGVPRGMKRCAITAAVVLGAGLGWAGAAAAAPEIQVLSNRADLISGGDALVAVTGVDPSGVGVDVDGRDVTDSFAVRPDGGFEGLLTDLKVGPSVVTARVPNGPTAQLTITNHP